MTTKPSNITENQRLLLHQTVYEMAKHGFLPKMLTETTLRFERPNSEAAVKLTTEPTRIIIRKDFTGPMMLGEPFIRNLVASGLYTLADMEGECALVSTDAD